MLVPNRHANTPEYRYGFQGQEMDDELKGEGNSLNYTFRMHDPRVGRFFAVDPLFRKYVHNSPYAFSENKLIQFVELEGQEIDIPKIDKINYGSLGPRSGATTFIANTLISAINGFTGAINYTSELVVGDEEDMYGAAKIWNDLYKSAKSIHQYATNTTPDKFKKDAKAVLTDVGTYEDFLGAVILGKAITKLPKAVQVARPLTIVEQSKI